MEDLGLNRVAGSAALVKRERWVALFLFAIVCVLAGVMYAKWDTSALGGRTQPEAHAKSERKQEVDKRFAEGVVMLHGKQYEHALTAFHRVLQLAPEMPEAYVNAGFALLGMGKPKEAADFFDSATSLRPNQLNAYYGLGEALMAMGDKQAALQAMETYMHRSSPNDPFRRKAESAIWEMRAELSKDRPPLELENVPHRRRAAP